MGMVVLVTHDTQGTAQRHDKAETHHHSRASIHNAHKGRAVFSQARSHGDDMHGSRASNCTGHTWHTHTPPAHTRTRLSWVFPVIARCTGRSSFRHSNAPAALTYSAKPSSPMCCTSQREPAQALSSPRAHTPRGTHDHAVRKNKRKRFTYTWLDSATKWQRAAPLALLLRQQAIALQDVRCGAWW